MLQVLIVEDEKHDITLLKNAIDWDGLSLELAGIAYNGVDALELEEKTHPDIIITDIVMPKQSGIEFVSQLKGRGSEAHIVFISGHQDFDYARYGISAGIDAYVLKPVHPKTINPVLRKIVEDCVAAKKLLWENELFRNELDNHLPYLRNFFLKRWLVSGAVPENFERQINFYRIPLKNKRLCVIVFAPDSVERNDDNEYSRQLICFKIQRSIEEIVATCSHAYCLYLDAENRYAVILNCEDRDESFLMNFADRIIKNVQMLCQLSMTAGIGSIAEDFRTANQSYLNAITSIEHRFFIGGGTVILFDGVSCSSDIKLTLPLQFADTITQSVIQGDLAALHDGLTNLHTMLTPLHTSSKTEIARSFCVEILSTVIINISRIYGNAIVELFRNSAPYRDLFDLNTLSDIICSMERVMVQLIGILENITGDRYSAIVDSIRFAIDENLDQPLTVENISEKVHLSRGYATHLFKRVTGMNINRYLIVKRIAKAKQMMETTDMHIADIAKSVGYDNAAYFSSVFRNETGMIPTEYRRKTTISAGNRESEQ